MKLTEGMRVGLTKDFKLIEGKVKTLYNDMSVAIIELDNGDVAKVQLDRLVILDNQPQDNKNNEDKKEGSRVITKEEFKNALYSVTKELIKGDEFDKFINGSLAYVVGVSIHEKIYANEDSITVTRDELRKLIIKYTTPTSLSNQVDNQLSKGELVPTSLTALSILRELEGYFFDEDLC